MATDSRELVSPVMTRDSCRVYRIKQQTNQVATMGLTSQATAAVAASDTDVEFSSRLLQTILVCSLAKHTGVVMLGTFLRATLEACGRFSLTITVTLSLVATMKRRGATVARTRRGLKQMEASIRRLSRSRQATSLSLTLFSVLRFAIYSEFVSRLRVVAALLRWTTYNAAQRCYGFLVPDGSNPSTD